MPGPDPPSDSSDRACGVFATTQWSVVLLAALQPVLADGARLRDAQALAAELGTTAGALATAATRMRRRYRALIDDEVARALDDRADLAAKLKALREAWL